MPPPEYDIGHAMGSLMNDDTYADFKIELKDGTQLSRHKVILALRCGLVSGILRAGDRAPGGDRLVIDDLEPRAARSMVGFMYTGKLETDDCSVIDLAE
eukprot:gene18363-51351_t